MFDARTLLRRHGLPDAEPVFAPHQGEVNRTYLAGDYVVRIVRVEMREALEDWRTEIFAHPYVHIQGIRTPRLVAWGDHYTVLERAEGRNMDADASPAFFLDLGAQLARVHALPMPPDPDGALDDHSGPSPIHVELLPETLRPLAASLAAYAGIPAEGFIHGDVMPGNILVTPEDEAVLIDWGDAGQGHPAYDLAFVPLIGLKATLEGYEAAGGRVDADFRRRLVALRLEAAAYRASVGERAWADEAVDHLGLLTHLAR